MWKEHNWKVTYIETFELVLESSLVYEILSDTRNPLYSWVIKSAFIEKQI